MSKTTLLKTLRLRRDTFEALAAIAEAEKRDFDSLCQEALEEWLRAKARVELEKEIEAEARQNTLNYDEFWEGVDLD